MTADGWTVPDALDQFAAAGMPLDETGFRAFVRAARRVGKIKPIGEKRKPAGSEGGRGAAIYDIAQMQLMHKDAVAWLGLPAPGDT